MRRGRLAFAGVPAGARRWPVAAVTVAFALATGFDRAAREADLPDVIVRFRTASRAAEIDARVAALPNVAARSYRLEITDVRLCVGRRALPGRGVEIVRGRRGYAIVDGRDVDRARANEVVIEQRGRQRVGPAASATMLRVGRLGPLRVVGDRPLAPDNVAFPLASAPRDLRRARWLGARRPQPLPRRHTR